MPNPQSKNNLALNQAYPAGDCLAIDLPTRSIATEFLGQSSDDRFAKPLRLLDWLEAFRVEMFGDFRI
jgi:hypothetical protein